MNPANLSRIDLELLGRIYERDEGYKNYFKDKCSADDIPHDKILWIKANEVMNYVRKSKNLSAASDFKLFDSPRDKDLVVFMKYTVSENIVLSHLQIEHQRRYNYYTVIFLPVYTDNELTALYVSTAGYAWNVPTNICDPSFVETFPLQIAGGGAVCNQVHCLLGNYRSKNSTFKEHVDLKDLNLGEVCTSFTAKISTLGTIGKQNVQEFLFNTNKTDAIKITVKAARIIFETEITLAELKTLVTRVEQIYTNQVTISGLERTKIKRLLLQQSKEIEKQLKDELEKKLSKVIKQCTVAGTGNTLGTNNHFLSNFEVCHKQETQYTKAKNVTMEYKKIFIDVGANPSADRVFAELAKMNKEASATTSVSLSDDSEVNDSEVHSATTIVLSKTSNSSSPDKDVSSSSISSASSNTSDSSVDSNGSDTALKLLQSTQLSFKATTNKVQKEALFLYLRGHFYSNLLKKHYWLLNGKWYYVDEEFLLGVHSEYQDVLRDHLMPHSSPPGPPTLYIPWEVSDGKELIKEEIYNVMYKDIPGYYIGDQITPLGIEYFDIIYDETESQTTYLYVVKKGFEQTTRDACSQLKNSVRNLQNIRKTGSHSHPDSLHLPDIAEKVFGNDMELCERVLGLNSSSNNVKLVFVLALQPYINMSKITTHEEVMDGKVEINNLNDINRYRNLSLERDLERVVPLDVIERYIESDETYKKHLTKFFGAEKHVEGLIDGLEKHGYLILKSGKEGERKSYDTTPKLLFMEGRNLNDFQVLFPDGKGKINMKSTCRSTKLMLQKYSIHSETLLPILEIIRCRNYVTNILNNASQFKICEILVPADGSEEKKPKETESNKSEKTGSLQEQVGKEAPSDRKHSLEGTTKYETSDDGFSNNKPIKIKNPIEELLADQLSSEYTLPSECKRQKMPKSSKTERGSKQALSTFEMVTQPIDGESNFIHPSIKVLSSQSPDDLESLTEAKYTDPATPILKFPFGNLTIFDCTSIFPHLQRKVASNTRFPIELPEYAVGWLHDVVIDAFLYNLTASDTNVCITTAVAHTIFSEQCEIGKLADYLPKEKGYRGHAKLIDYKTVDKVIVPRNLRESHWIIYCVDLVKKTVLCLDPMGGGKMIPEDDLNKLRSLFTNDVTKEIGDSLRSSLPKNKPPLQKDGSSCGLFILYYSGFLCNDEPIKPEAFDLNDFRLRVFGTLSGYCNLTKQTINQCRTCNEIVGKDDFLECCAMKYTINIAFLRVMTSLLSAENNSFQ